MTKTLGNKNSDTFFNRIKPHTREGIIGYLFMIPTVVGVVLFILYPLVTTTYYSFTDWNGAAKAHFVGWDNYIYLLTKDPTFFSAIKATLYYVVLVVPITLIVGLLLALLLNKPLKGIKIFRTIFYVPVVLPAVATLVMFKLFFADDYGIVNQLLSAMNLPRCPFLTGESTVMPTLLIIALWTVGSQMIIFLAGLQSVPADVYEAAEIDGATGFRKFWQITIPMISPILGLQLITNLIAGFQVINPPLLLTNGGPNLSTYFLNYSIYQSAFLNHAYGYAMAEVWILILIIAVISFPVFKLTDAYTYYESTNN